MQANEIIKTINAASKIEDVLNISNIKNEFNDIAMLIHPDRCSEAGASDAIAKLNVWRDIFENGKQYKDDIGTFKTNGYWATFYSAEPNLSWSIENFRIMKDWAAEANNFFKAYLPSDAKLQADGSVKFLFDKRAIPLSGLVLPQQHVNWVLNRLLEYCAFLSEVGMSHCGLTPESVFIVPETHGIQICSFYHMTRIGNIMKTISGKYQNWYPQDVFSTKTATAAIDIEMAKKTAAYLLGEASGSAVKLRKTHNEDFVNFLISRHDNAFKALTEYRELLAKNFKKEFHSLTI